jgi:hypothetical protein
MYTVRKLALSGEMDLSELIRRNETLIEPCNETSQEFFHVIRKKQIISTAHQAKH